MFRRPRKIRILMTGGGTGGHIYPLAAVARQLDKLLVQGGYDPDIRYFGDPGNFKDYLTGRGIRLVHITSSKMRRYFDIQNFFDFFRFFIGFFQSLWKIYWFMPNAAFSKGGPGALAVVKACAFYTIPLVIHESDAVPGLTNKLSEGSARVVDLAFASAGKFFKQKKPVHFVGNPVREEIEASLNIDLLKGDLGFDPKEPVVLVIGGSQGAEKFNSFVMENFLPLAQKFQILHQVGIKNYAGYKQEFDLISKKFPPELLRRYVFVPYFDRDISRAYAAADIVIARSGGTIFELAALGKPAILVPFPESANDHQLANAYEYARTGAAVVIEEENLLPNLVLTELGRILGNRGEYEKMSSAAKKFFIPNSAELIANDIIQLIWKQ